MKHLALFLALLVVVTAGCRTRGPKFDPLSSGAENAEFADAELTNRLDQAMLTPSTDPYRLGPGDVIEVEVIGESKNITPMAVGPDGKIYYNLLPGLSVWGLSLADTRALLQREMAKFTRATPELVVHLRGVVSKRVWVLGAVPGPGVYTLSTPTTLLDALAAAGNTEGASGAPSARGPKPVVDDGAADYSRSFVLRNGRRLPINFERLLKGGDLSQNVYLEPDDFIFIRPVDVPNVSVLGAVNSPHILPYASDLTIVDAIIGSGGTVKYAQNGRVVIVRGGLTDPKIAVVDFHAIVTGKALNVRLQPGDIVYVPFTPFRKLAQLTEEVLDQFVRTVAVNEATFIISGQDAPVPITAPYGIQQTR